MSKGMASLPLAAIDYNWPRWLTFRRLHPISNVLWYASLFFFPFAPSLITPSLPSRSSCLVVLLSLWRCCYSYPAFRTISAQYRYPRQRRHLRFVNPGRPVCLDSSGASERSQVPLLAQATHLAEPRSHRRHLLFRESAYEKLFVVKRFWHFPC